MSQSPFSAKWKLANLLSLNSSALQLALLIRLQEFVIGHLRSWSRRRGWVCCITRGARASPGKRNEPLVFDDESGVEHNSTPGQLPSTPSWPSSHSHRLHTSSWASLPHSLHSSLPPLYLSELCLRFWRRYRSLLSTAVLFYVPCSMFRGVFVFVQSCSKFSICAAGWWVSRPESRDPHPMLTREPATCPTPRRMKIRWSEKWKHKNLISAHFNRTIVFSS